MTAVDHEYESEKAAYQQHVTEAAQSQDGTRTALVAALQDAEREIMTLLQDLCDEPGEDISANRTLATIREALHKAGAP